MKMRRKYAGWNQYCKDRARGITPSLARQKLATQIETAVITLVILLALVSVVGMWRSGIGSRVFSKNKVTMQKIDHERDVYMAWKSGGVKGRTVIHFGKHMPVKKISQGDLKKLLKEDGNLKNDNYLYAALRSNHIRRIFGVVPDSEWPKVKKLLSARRRFTVDEKGASTWMDGLPLHSGSLAKLPQVNEPVVLNFSADYFVEQDTSARAVVEQLKKSGIEFDLVTITAPSTKKPGYRRASAEIKKLRSLLAKDK